MPSNEWIYYSNGVFHCLTGPWSKTDPITYITLYLEMPEQRWNCFLKPTDGLNQLTLPYFWITVSRFHTLSLPLPFIRILKILKILILILWLSLHSHILQRRVCSQGIWWEPHVRSSSTKSETCCDGLGAVVSHDIQILCILCVIMLVYYSRENRVFQLGCTCSPSHSLYPPQRQPLTSSLYLFPIQTQLHIPSRTAVYLTLSLWWRVLIVSGPHTRRWLNISQLRPLFFFHSGPCLK